MKIAILIGVSNYDTQDDLPSCSKDVTAIREVLEQSKNYSMIKSFDNDTNGAIMKKGLTDLFSSFKGQDIKELFFYFSGHGQYYQDDFYYILSDFDQSKRRQTSLQNSEIDNLIKSINPALVIKVIDACQSGVSYIKGEDQAIEKYYRGTSGGFGNCYFLNSSMANQSSYASEDLSAFTKSFLRSIMFCAKPEIRYKDIIDFISDEFEKEPQQTPFFISQADYTEYFISCSIAVKQVLQKYLPEKNPENKPDKLPEQPIKTTLLDLIKADADLYISAVEAKNNLNDLLAVIEGIALTEELADIYDKTIQKDNIYDLPNRISIGKWLIDNPNEYFAVPTYEDVAYEEEANEGRLVISIADMLRSRRTVTKYRKVISGYELTADAPYESIYISLRPKYPNLPHYTCILVFLFSKKDIRFFYAFVGYKEKNWTSKEINTNFKWNSATFRMLQRDEIQSFAKELVEDFNQYVLDSTRRKFD